MAMYNFLPRPGYLVQSDPAVGGWLVVLGFRHTETLFQSISARLPERRRKKREMIDERNIYMCSPNESKVLFLYFPVL